MTRCVAFAAMLSGAAFGSLQESPQVFHARVDVVSLDVSVRRGAAPVSGLVSADFTLLDDGVVQRCDVLTHQAVPLDVTLIFDENPLSKLIYGSGFKADVLKIGAMLRAGDRISVITDGRSVRELVPMAPAESLASRDLTVLTDAKPASDRSDRDVLHDPELDGISLVDALLLALARPVEPDRRHLVVVFTDGANSGVLDSSALGPLAQRSDALLHVVLKPPYSFVYHGRTITRQWVDPVTRAALADAARLTGGEVHNMKSGVGAFKTVLDEFRNSYVLQYTLTGVARPGWHTVKITVPRMPDATIQARPGYFGS